ncbi:MAG: TIGR01777 family oxidoreductase [Micrococcales bacterium]
MRVLISGATGLIGTELAKQLKARGDEPVRLVRRAVEVGDRPDSEEIPWNPSSGYILPGAIENVDAVINLAGATTGKLPWTKKYERELIDSRLDSTRTLVKAINEAKKKPKVLVSGSASGFYGDTGTECVLESAPNGEGFLAELAGKWEAEAEKASIRTVLVRTTMVCSKKLGALGRLLPMLKAGIAGPLGSGKQWWAWISLADEARAILHLIDTDSAVGPFNLTAPQPATCTEVIQALGKELGRPTIIPVPAFALRLAFGKGADELLLCNQNMNPAKLLATGFKFEHPDLQSMAKYVLSK